METIDKGMIAAIQEAAGRLGSQNELSRKSGVPQQQISSYLSGKTKGISLENWLKLLPHIKAYLPADHPSLRSSQAAGPRLAMFADGAGGGANVPAHRLSRPGHPARARHRDAPRRMGAARSRSPSRPHQGGQPPRSLGAAKGWRIIRSQKPG